MREITRLIPDKEGVRSQTFFGEPHIVHGHVRDRLSQACGDRGVSGSTRRTELMPARVVGA